MAKIIYLISHGHTARGVLQTGLLKMLSKFADIHVIAKTESVIVLKDTIEAQGATIHACHYTSKAFDEQRGILRAHVHQNIKRNPALWEKHLRNTRHSKNSLKKRAINHFYFYLGAGIRLFPGGKYLFKKYEQSGFHKPVIDQMLKSIQPDLIISTRPVDYMEAYLLESARRLGIHRVMYILSWDNITSKGFFPVLANSYLTWSAIMNQELKDYYGIPDSSIYTTGVTHFDVHAQVRDQRKSGEEILNSIGLNNSLPYIFFTMSASYFAPNEIDIIEYLASEVEANSFGPEMQLVIRPHMANLMADRSDQSWLNRLKKLDSNRVKTDFPKSENTLLTWYMAQDDMLRLSTLLYNASVCLNSGSTVAIEALYLDKPVVITAFDTEQQIYMNSARRLIDYIHLRKLFDMSACKVVHDLQQLKEAIIFYLNNPKADSKQRKYAVEQECFKNDGKATQRFVDNIQEIIHRL